MQPELELLHTENRRLSALVAALAEKNLRLEEALAQRNGSFKELPVPQDAVAAHPDQLHGSSKQVAVPEAELTGIPGILPVPLSPLPGFATLLPNLSAPLTVPSGKLSIPFDPLSGPPAHLTVPLVPLTESPAGLPVPQSPLPGAMGLPPDLAEAWQRTWSEAQYRARLQRCFSAGIPEQKVCGALRSGPMAGCRDSHIADAARLLLWLCGQPPHRVSYGRLRAVTGLSDSGNNKLLASLRKKGLIRWKSAQVYEVADAGAVLLESLLDP